MRQITFEPFSVTQFDVFEYGAGDGPNVLITAAIHGDEQTAVHAARLLMKRLETETIRGKVRVIPVVNTASYRNRTRRSPFDQLDMNRIFPGSAAGSPTMQLAHTLTEESRDADYIVDLHCCGMGGSTYTLALSEEFPAVKEVAQALGIKTVVQSGGTRGQFFVEACHAGAKAVIIELPWGQPGGVIDLDSAEEAHQAVLNLLRHVGVLEGAVKQSPVIFCGKIKDVSAPAPGLFLPAVTAGQSCAEGAVLGTFDGEPVLAPVAGVITSLSLPRYCFAGERLAGVAQA